MNRSCMDHSSSTDNACISKQGSVEDLGTRDSVMYEIALQKKGNRLPIQIFPESVLGPEGTLGCAAPGKERLPSIVVEPTDINEVESGELRWPPLDREDSEDEDLFLEQCIPPANIADWGEEDEADDESIVFSNQPNNSLSELQSDDLGDDPPTLLPENSSPAPN